MPLQKNLNPCYKRLFSEHSEKSAQPLRAKRAKNMEICHSTKWKYSISAARKPLQIDLKNEIITWKKRFWVVVLLRSTVNLLEIDNFLGLSAKG